MTGEIFINFLYYCFDVLDFGLFLLVFFIVSFLSALVGFLISYLIFNKIEKR